MKNLPVEYSQPIQMTGKALRRICQGPRKLSLICVSTFIPNGLYSQKSLAEKKIKPWTQILGVTSDLRPTEMQENSLAFKILFKLIAEQVQEGIPR